MQQPDDDLFIQSRREEHLIRLRKKIQDNPNIQTQKKVYSYSKNTRFPQFKTGRPQTEEFTHRSRWKSFRNPCYAENGTIINTALRNTIYDRL